MLNNRKIKQNASLQKKCVLDKPKTNTIKQHFILRQIKKISIYYLL